MNDSIEFGRGAPRSIHPALQRLSRPIAPIPLRQGSTHALASILTLPPRTMPAFRGETDAGVTLAGRRASAFSQRKRGRSEEAESGATSPSSGADAGTAAPRPRVAGPGAMAAPAAPAAPATLVTLTTTPEPARSGTPDATGSAESPESPDASSPLLRAAATLPTSWQGVLQLLPLLRHLSATAALRDRHAEILCGLVASAPPCNRADIDGVVKALQQSAASARTGRVLQRALYQAVTDTALHQDFELGLLRVIVRQPESPVPWCSGALPGVLAARIDPRCARDPLRHGKALGNAFVELLSLSLDPAWHVALARATVSLLDKADDPGLAPRLLGLVLARACAHLAGPLLIDALCIRAGGERMPRAQRHALLAAVCAGAEPDHVRRFWHHLTPAAASCTARVALHGRYLDELFTDWLSRHQPEVMHHAARGLLDVQADAQAVRDIVSPALARALREAKTGTPAMLTGHFEIWLAVGYRDLCAALQSGLRSPWDADLERIWQHAEEAVLRSLGPHATPVGLARALFRTTRTCPDFLADTAAARSLRCAMGGILAAHGQEAGDPERIATAQGLIRSVNATSWSVTVREQASAWIGRRAGMSASPVATSSSRSLTSSESASPSLSAIPSPALSATSATASPPANGHALT